MATSKFEKLFDAINAKISELEVALEHDLSYRNVEDYDANLAAINALKDVKRRAAIIDVPSPKPVLDKALLALQKQLNAYIPYEDGIQYVATKFGLTELELEMAWQGNKIWLDSDLEV
jgi:hypothetical protein